MSGLGDGVVLVTGAAGLVGHAVRLQLKALGRRVLAVDVSTGEVEGRPVLAADVADPHALYGLALRERIGGIVHCGALSGPMVGAGEPARVVAINVVGTTNVLELARRIEGARVVFASSTSAVGPTPPGLSLVPEAVPLNPSTVYGASKAASEALVAGYAREHGVDGVSLRLSWVYGSRRTTACSLRRMLTDALASRPTRLTACANARRQYVHVDDAANALVQALETRSLPQPVYTITGGNWLALETIANEVHAAVPGAEVHFGPGDLDDDVQAEFDLSAARCDIGYTPRVALAAGIAHYRDQPVMGSAS